MNITCFMWISFHDFMMSFINKCLFSLLFFILSIMLKVQENKEDIDLVFLLWINRVYIHPGLTLIQKDNNAKEFMKWISSSPITSVLLTTSQLTLYVTPVWAKAILSMPPAMLLENLQIVFYRRHCFSWKIEWAGASKSFLVSSYSS